MIPRPIDRVVDLTDSQANRLFGMSLEEARARGAGGSRHAVFEIDGSFALVGRDGDVVRMARSLDRPVRYFLARARSSDGCAPFLTKLPSASSSPAAWTAGPSSSQSGISFQSSASRLRG